MGKGTRIFSSDKQFCRRIFDFLQEGLWGLYTLGEEVPRDNSIFLLAEGIISVLIIGFGVALYYFSLRDAWVNGKNVMQVFRLIVCANNTNSC